MRSIYVVFSATPTGMGRLIRLATRREYNHVSLVLDRDLGCLWSFARYHRNAPLYGGLVRESPLRYSGARLKVCRLWAAEERCAALAAALEDLWVERETYIYNTPAALASLAGRRPALPRAHTCVSFVQAALERFGLAEVPGPPTVRALEEALAPLVIYEGPARPVRGTAWGEDRYPEKLSRRRAACSTARHFGRLTKRAVLGLC